MNGLSKLCSSGHVVKSFHCIRCIVYVFLKSLSYTFTPIILIQVQNTILIPSDLTSSQPIISIVTFNYLPSQSIPKLFAAILKHQQINCASEEVDLLSQRNMKRASTYKVRIKKNAQEKPPFILYWNFTYY